LDFQTNTALLLKILIQILSQSYIKISFLLMRRQKWKTTMGNVDRSIKYTKLLLKYDVKSLVTISSYHLVFIKCYKNFNMTLVLTSHEKIYDSDILNILFLLYIVKFPIISGTPTP
jgi:hypothetical protein